MEMGTSSESSGPDPDVKCEPQRVGMVGRHSLHSSPRFRNPVVVFPRIIILEAYILEQREVP
jgi:hypothetical protein